VEELLLLLFVVDEDEDKSAGVGEVVEGRCSHRAAFHTEFTESGDGGVAIILGAPRKKAKIRERFSNSNVRVPCASVREKIPRIQ